MSIRCRSVRELVFNNFTFAVSVIASFGLFIHFKTDYEFEVPEKWIENVRHQCPHLAEVDPERANVEKFAYGAGILGVYLGVIIEQRVLEIH